MRSTRLAPVVAALRRNALAIALAATALGLIAPSAALAQQGTYEVHNADSVYVRPKPQSWAIGTLYRVGPNVRGVEHIDVQEVSPEGWAYGYIYGSFDGCGWVDVELPAQGRLEQREDLLDRRRDAPARAGVCCSPSGRTRSARTAATTTRSTARRRPDHRAGRTATTAAARFVNKYGDLPVNKAVDWRYTTKDGNAAMIKDTSNGVGAPAVVLHPRRVHRPRPPAGAGASSARADADAHTHADGSRHHHPTRRAAGAKRRRSAGRRANRRYCKRFASSASARSRAARAAGARSAARRRAERTRVQESGSDPFLPYLHTRILKVRARALSRFP